MCCSACGSKAIYCLLTTLQQCQNASINWVGMLEAPGLAKTDLHVRRVDSLSSREADQF